MAQDKEKEAVPQKKPRKKLVVALAALVILGAAGGAGAWYYQNHPALAHKKAKEEPPKPPVFVSLETFTVNLQPDPAEQFLQVDLTLQLADEAEAELIKQHMPEVRNRLLMLLTSKKSSEISSVEGKKKLSVEISAQLKEAFVAGSKLQKVAGVFFTSFVIQ